MVKMNGCAAMDSVRLFGFPVDKAAVAADFHLRNGTCHGGRRGATGKSGKSPYRSSHKWQAMRVWTHIALFANPSVAGIYKNLLGSTPNPRTIFSKSAALLRSLMVNPTGKEN